MKTKLKIFKFIALLALFNSFYSCQEDEILIETDNKTFELKTSRVSINQVINEINTQEFKQKLQNKNFDSSISNALLRTNDSDVYFIKKEKDDELISYILHLNSYSQSKPYFLKLIITQNNNETERMGYIKYIPTSPISILDMSTFSGEVQILDNNFEVNATSNYVNGVKQEIINNDFQNRLICTDQISVTEIRCSRGGEHGVGGTCFANTNPIPSDAYYYISVTTVCTGDRSTPTQIIDDYGNNNDGGTSSVNVGMALAHNFSLNLTSEQKLIYDLNQSIAEYLADNVIVVPDTSYNPILGGNPTMVIIDPQAEQIVLEFVNNTISSGLDLDFKKSLKSPANVDVTSIDTTTIVGKKFNCIYKKLMQSTSFKNLFDNTFGGTQTKLNVKFEIVESFPNPNTLGNCQLTTISNNGVPQQYNNLIKIKREILDETNGIGYASNIKIAKVIIHELMHAYLNIKYKNCNQGASLPYINNLEIGELIQLFYDNFNCHIDVNGSPQSQHDFMYNFLIPSFQSILSECRDLLISQSHINYANGLTFEDTSLNINENWNWDKFFKYITLNGLHNCDSFTETTTNNPIENYFYQSYSQYENQVTKNCL